MDGSNGNSASNGNPTNPQQQRTQHPGDTSRAVRAELEAKRRAAVEKHRRYQPAVRAQMGRVFGDTYPAWYARLRLLTPATYGQLAELSVLGLAVGHDRLLTDTEARAVTEHAARGADRMALISWGLTGVALFFTWRGRHTMRFPLWTPHVVPPPPGAYLRKTMWHGARYVAYSAAVGVTVQAPLMAYNVVYEKQQMAQDGRLRALRDEEGNFRGQKRPAADGFGEGSFGGEDEEQQQQQRSIQEAAEAGWDTYKSEQQQQQQQPPQQQQYGQGASSQGSAAWGNSYGQSSSAPAQQSSSGWDGADDVDDASPVASSSSNDSSYASGGSTWDRLRQQSQGTNNNTTPQQQQRWGRQQSQQQQQQQPAEQQSWGNSGDSADRAAQDKAQRDFDRLVDRDRQGEGQGRSGWGGR